MDKYLVGPDEVERQLEVAGRINTDVKSTEAVVKELVQRMPFDTGWIPPGLRSYTQSGHHAQMVIVAPPGVNRINWGRFERDNDCKQYLLAQPWRVIIADTIDGNLFGVRMFYSPGPVNSLDTQLYHQNVPNINCRGYRGNGVGWVCLYQNENWKGWSLAQKMERIIERCSGSEAYNDANMDSTDGPRFYADNGAPKYVYDPVSWEKKTEKEGVEWTFDSSLWLPVLVKDDKHQDQHYDNGQPLTLEMAMNGQYNAYYGDKYHPKPAIEHRNGRQPYDPALFRESYATADGAPAVKAKKKTTEKTAKTAPTKKVLTEPDPLPGFDNPDDDYENCDSCGAALEVDQGHPAEWGLACDGCISGLWECPNCNVWCAVVYQHPDGVACGECNPDFICFVCDGDFGGNHRHMIDITPKDGVGVVENAELCPDCVDAHMICAGCGHLRKAHDDIFTTVTMEMLCYECIEMCEDCGLPVSKDDEGHQADCNPAFLQQA